MVENTGSAAIKTYVFSILFFFGFCVFVTQRFCQPTKKKKSPNDTVPIVNFAKLTNIIPNSDSLPPLTAPLEHLPILYESLHTLSLY